MSTRWLPFVVACFGTRRSRCLACLYGWRALRHFRREMELLHRLALHWLQGDPRRLERAAALRDVEALVAAAPVNLRSLRSAQLPAAVPLIDLADALSTLLRRCILGNMRTSAPHEPLIVSPFAGGVSCLRFVEPPLSADRPTQLKVAFLNPGRTGLASLGTNTFLHWRLQANVATLQHESVDISALPGRASRWVSNSRKTSHLLG